MAKTPTPNPQFQPAFKRVAQSSELDDVLACTAMLSNRPLDQVRTLATAKFQIPTQGAWWLTEAMVAELLQHFGFVAGTWKEASKTADLPDLCLLLLGYKENRAALGRHALFVRQRDAGGIEYIIDPHPATPAEKQVSVDLSELQTPLWYISVQPMKGSK